MSFSNNEANPEALLTVKLSEYICLNKRQVPCWRKRVLGRSAGPDAEYHHSLARGGSLKRIRLSFLAMDGE